MNTNPFQPAARSIHDVGITSGAVRNDATAWRAGDGTWVTLRPIEPSDFEREREFVAGLSKATGYQRLMSGRTPTTDELQRWTNIDREREGAIIATVTQRGHERQIGVARYAMEAGSDEAEFAIVISDVWQGRGLGAQLLSRLIVRARQSGVKTLFGTTLSENSGMRTLARRLGFKLSREPGAAYLTTMCRALNRDDRCGAPPDGDAVQHGASPG
jgi:acetyltransferase